MDERLHKFARLVDAGSFTKAAAELHLSQPALTTAIAKLERELHCQLLVRHNRTFSITPAGELAYKTAKQLVLGVGNLRTQLAELNSQLVETNIGLIDSLAEALFAAPASASSWQEVRNTSIIVDNTAFLLQAVEHDDIAIAFVTGSDLPAKQALQITLLSTEPLVLVCHQQRAQQAAQDYKAHTVKQFISYDHGSRSYQIILHSLQEHQLQPRTRYSSTSPAVMLQLVLHNQGTAVLPYALVEHYVEQGMLVLVGDTRPLIIMRPICSVARRGKSLPPSAISITKHIKDLLEAQQASLAIKIRSGQVPAA